MRTARELRRSLWVAPLAGVLSAVLLTAAGLAAGMPIFLPFALVLLVVLVVVPVRRRRRRTAGRAKHFALATGGIEAARGENVTARLELLSPEEVKGALRIGLVCTCRHDVLETSGGDSNTSHRVTKEATAYEHWHEASASERLQSHTFEIPPDGPFSHEGTCLSFAWSVRAQERRSGRSDPFLSEPIWVSP